MDTVTEMTNQRNPRRCLPVGFIAAIVAFGVVRAIIKKVYLNGSYDRQYISTNLPGSNHTNNIFSLGVSYSY